MSSDKNPLLDEPQSSGSIRSRTRTISGSYSAPSTPNLSSPIPLSNFEIYIGNASGCSTPESEVEASLAYKGSDHYDSKAKVERKQKKRNKLASSVSVEDENEIAHQIELEGKNSVFDESTDDEIEDENQATKNKSTQTYPEQEKPASKQVRLRYASTSEKVGPKVPQTYTVESRGMQSELSWSYVEGVFQNMIDVDDLDELKKMLAKLQNDLVGKTLGRYEVRFHVVDSGDDLSEGSVAEVENASRTEAKSSVVKKASSIAKQKDSNTGAEKESRRVSLAPPQEESARRISSAHCLGGRKGTMGALEEGNIFDMFKSGGKNAKPVQPQILKYVGEKGGLEVDYDDVFSEKSFIRGWYDGLCQFCGAELLEIPTLEEIMDAEKAPKIEYCCPSFKYFINFHLENEDPDEPDDEVIDINPNAPFGARRQSIAARKRALDRKREQEMERQKAAAQQANMFAFARQMKTLSYSLASSKCMSDGWTVKPTTPKPPSPPPEENQFAVEMNTTLLQTAGVHVNKNYDDGRRFLTIFPDGTGCLYYPSGNVAVLITSVEKGKYTYIVQTNKSYNNLQEGSCSGLLAIFEPNGNSVCYHRKSNRIKTFINAHGGIELDRRGRRRKRWQWYFTKSEGRSPPFHPLQFSLNKFISVRILNQHNIALIFASNKRSIRFNVGAQIKALTFRGRGHFQGNESEKYLSEKRKEIAGVLRNIHRTMRLPKTGREGKFPTTSMKKKDKLKSLLSDAERGEDGRRGGETMVNFDPLPPICVAADEGIVEKHSF